MEDPLMLADATGRACAGADGAAQMQRPHALLTWGAVLVPVLKCALCPMCLGVFGSVFAGARLGFLANERLHGAVLAGAIIADVGILAASARHHVRGGPLLVCAGGSLLALLGHFAWRQELLEYTGFALLIVASLWNMRLIWAHRHVAGSCCPHGSAPASPAARSQP